MFAAAGAGLATPYCEPAPGGGGGATAGANNGHVGSLHDDEGEGGEAADAGGAGGGKKAVLRKLPPPIAGGGAPPAPRKKLDPFLFPASKPMHPKAKTSLLSSERLAAMDASGESKIEMRGFFNLMVIVSVTYHVRLILEASARTIVCL